MTSVPIPIVCIYNLSSLCFIIIAITFITAEIIGRELAAVIATWCLILFVVDQLILGPLYYFATKQEDPNYVD